MAGVCSRRLKNKFTLTEELLLMALHISMWSTIKVQHSNKSQSNNNKKIHGAVPHISLHLLTLANEVLWWWVRWCLLFSWERNALLVWTHWKSQKYIKKKKFKLKPQVEILFGCREKSWHLSQWRSLLREETGQAYSILALYLKANPTAHQTPLMVSKQHEEQSCLPSLRLHFFSSAAASKPTKHDNKM